MRERLDPRNCNITLDANAVDRDGGLHDGFVDRLLGLRQLGKINFEIPGSVRGEVQHPNTPAEVKSAVLPEIFSIGVSRTAGEHAALRQVQGLLQGNAAPGKHDADAFHLCEAAQKCGGGYFITHDRRVLERREKLRPLLGSAFRIVTLCEFLETYDEFAARRPR
jgi:hypothetical protein